MKQAVTNMSVTDYQHMDTCPLGSDWNFFQNSAVINQVTLIRLRGSDQ